MVGRFGARVGNWIHCGGLRNEDRKMVGVEK